MTEAPIKPSLNANGAYDAADLARYFREAKEMGDAEIARHLGVDVHRVVYMRGRMKTP